MRAPELSGRGDARSLLLQAKLDDGLCNLSATYPKPTTIQHWQLRDLVHCPHAKGEVFSVHHSRVLRHDLRTCSSETAAQLSFEPTCVAVAGGYLAAAGQRSQLDVRFRGAAVYTGACGFSVNNALRVDASRSLRLFVCNNDSTIKIFSLDRGVLLGTVACPAAANHCALSPDGNSLVAVGDDRHTYMYNAEPSGWRQVRRYLKSYDAGMSCDWSPSGACFAAASQDGSVVVLDPRCCDGAPLARFSTPLACRNVRFSPGPLDLLAFTEHRGRFHVADARVWSRQQVLHVGAVPELEPDVSGLAWSPCGSALYVGLEDAIMSYNVDTMARTSFPMADLA